MDGGQASAAYLADTAVRTRGGGRKGVYHKYHQKSRLAIVQLQKNQGTSIIIVYIFIKVLKKINSQFGH